MLTINIELNFLERWCLKVSRIVEQAWRIVVINTESMYLKDTILLAKQFCPSLEISVYVSECSIVIYEISAYILTEKCLIFRCLIYKFLVHLICTGLVVFDNLQNKINPLLFVFPANSILLTLGQIPFHNKKYQRLSIYTHLPF